MGNDWYLYKLVIGEDKLIENPKYNDECTIIWRQCSTNFVDIFQKYGFDKNVLHGHCGPVVTDYLSKIINKMLDSKVKALTVEQLEMYKDSTNFWWGLDKNKNKIDQWLRESIVLCRLRHWRDIAEQHYDAYWYGDQTRFIGSYNLNGNTIKGFDFWPEEPQEDDSE